MPYILGKVRKTNVGNSRSTGVSSKGYMDLLKGCYSFTLDIKHRAKHEDRELLNLDTLHDEEIFEDLHFVDDTTGVALDKIWSLMEERKKCKSSRK